MNKTKSESKYFNTAIKMDKAFLELLGKKDFAYITVKEICEAAGVNRSTFYLHYETIGDLLSESVEYIYEHFNSYFNIDPYAEVSKLKNCTKEELNFITPKYLTPYLNFVKENKRLFKTAIENREILHLNDTYDRMFTHIFSPVLERYGIADRDRKYIMSFYIHGLIAIITRWLMQECDDSIDYIISIIQKVCSENKI